MSKKVLTNIKGFAIIINVVARTAQNTERATAANLENDTEKRKESHSEAEEILLKKEKEQSDSERVKRLKEDWKAAGFGESVAGK